MGTIISLVWCVKELAETIGKDLRQLHERFGETME